MVCQMVDFPGLQWDNPSLAGQDGTHVSRMGSPPLVEPRMHLTALIDLLRLERDVKISTIKQLSYTVRLFGRYLERIATIDDLNDDAANRWIEWLTTTPSRLGRPRKKATIKSQRDNLVTLWLFAWETDRVDQQPRRVKRIRLPRTLPEAWTEQQAAEWLSACDRIGGVVASCMAPARLVMRTWSLAAWDTAARACDLLELRRSEISAEGALVIQQEKTGYPVLCRLRPETMAAIDDLCKLHGADKIFPFSRATLDHHWQKVRKEAAKMGLEGTPKKLRKSRATSAERRERGSAPEILGHVPGSRVAYQHYVDRMQILPDPGLPPQIDRRQDIA